MWLYDFVSTEEDAGGCYDNLAPPPGNEGMESAVRQLQSNFTDVLVKWGQAFRFLLLTVNRNAQLKQTILTKNNVLNFNVIYIVLSQSLNYSFLWENFL